jgi:hypothetical protein
MITKSVRPKTWHEGIGVQYLVEANIYFLQNTQMSSANHLVPNTMRTTSSLPRHKAASILTFSDNGYLIPPTIPDRWALNLKYLMEQSPSGEANHFSASQEILHILCPTSHFL